MIDRRILLVDVECLFVDRDGAPKPRCGIPECDRGAWRAAEGECHRTLWCPRREATDRRRGVLDPARMAREEPSEFAAWSLEKLFGAGWELRYWSPAPLHHYAALVQQLAGVGLLTYATGEPGLLMLPDFPEDKLEGLARLLGIHFGDELNDPRCLVSATCCDREVARGLRWATGGRVAGHPAPDLWWDVAAVDRSRLDALLGRS